MQQANPEAGNPKASNSDGKGMWIARGDRVVGKWVETSADRDTHKFAGRLDLSFALKVKGDRLAETRSAQPFGIKGSRPMSRFKDHLRAHA